MLTQRGRTVLALGAGSFLAGRALALRELYMIAGGLLVILVVGLVAVLARRLALSVSRSAHPARTPAPGEIRVELTVDNRGPIGAGPILLEDALPSRLESEARLAIPVLPARSQRSVAYILRPRLRGVYALGPLQVALTDPFGLFLRRQQLPGTSHVVVYPAFERLRTMPSEIRRAGSVRRSPLLGQGDEFYALRGYVEGDDMRRVHWPTALKLGELFVRQNELLRQPGALVVLDTCEGKHRGQGAGASIEAAISACAAVSILAAESGMSVAVLTSDGFLLDGRNPSTDELLEALAMLEPSSQDTMLSALVSAARRRVAFTTIVVITPELIQRELGMVGSLVGSAAGGMCVEIDASSFGTGAPAAGAPLARLGSPVVRLRSGDSFRHVWEAGVRGVSVAR